MSFEDIENGTATAVDVADWQAIPDSWDTIEDDATINPGAYCYKHGIDLANPDRETATVAMIQHIIKRCKALANG